MERYLSLGKIVDTFSLDGSIKVISSTTNQDIRYKKGNKVIIKNGETINEYTVSSYRRSRNIDIVRFEEVDNINSALSLKGKEILVLKDRNDLKEGYYFYSDLRGCELVADGKAIGKVIEVEEFPAQLTLRAKTKEGKQFFVPFVKQFIKKVDIENKTIEIEYMEGML